MAAAALVITSHFIYKPEALPALGLGRPDESHLCEIPVTETRGLLFIFKKSSYRVVRIELASIFMFSCCTVFMKACVSRKQKHGLGANRDFVWGARGPI